MTAADRLQILVMNDEDHTVPPGWSDARMPAATRAMSWAPSGVPKPADFEYRKGSIYTDCSDTCASP